MTTVLDAPEAPDAPEVIAKVISGRQRFLRALMIGLGALLVISAVGEIAGTGELTSSSMSSAALRLSIPIMLAGLGAIYSERTGIVNIGLEGMMILGTWFGAWAAWRYGIWWGVPAGMIAGGIGGFVHAVATVTFNVDHIVSGVAINILGLGGMRFASAIAYDAESGGSAIQSPQVSTIGNFSVPFLAGGHIFAWKTPDFFGWLERQDWFLLSDFGGIARGFTGDLSWLTLIALAMVPLSIWLLWRTPWGLRLRSCGENPYAAESLGVPVYRMKYYGVVISGALSGLGGVFLVLAQAGLYREGQTGGRGFIGLASLIFGNWMPRGVFQGALLFGFGDSLRLRQPIASLALLLVIAIGLAALAIWSIRKGQRNAAIVMGVLAVLFWLGYAFIDEVPRQFIFIAPYLITLLVLSLATQRLRMPAYDGQRYRKGEAI